MARATAAETQEMNKKEAQVRAALDKAEAEVAALRYIPSLFLTGPQLAALKNLEAAKQRFEKWADATAGWRRWANDGQEPDGHPYPPSFWLRIGADILSELGVHVKAAEEGSAAAVARSTVAASAAQVKQAAAAVTDAVTKPWSLKTKLAVGGVVSLATLGVLSALLGKVNTLTGRKGA
jgi:multidrug resistance efflux pump